MSPDASFAVDSPHDNRCDVLVLGLSNPAFAGVTAVDYVSRHLESAEIGHVSPERVPAITPFVEGRPRNHTRIYDVTGTPLALVVGELFVPVWAASAFADALIEWADAASVEEIVVPYGVPYPHGPDDHAVFHVATDDYRERRLAGGDVPALGGGVLDGVVGEVMASSLAGEAPPTGAFVTPVHPPGPDLDAALLLLDALERTYGIDVDEAPLREQSAELHEYYDALSDRMAAVREESIESRDYPEDRAYM